VLGPNGGQRSQSSGSLDVTDNTDDNHRRSLDDGNGLNNLSLVHLGSGSVKVSDDVGHTGLVTHAGGKVDGLLGVILEVSDILLTVEKSGRLQSLLPSSLLRILHSDGRSLQSSPVHPHYPLHPYIQ
jgi:hypothetical protein